MKKCPYCHEEISSEAKFCNHCGKNVDAFTEQQSNEEPTSKEVVEQTKDDDIVEAKQEAEPDAIEQQEEVVPPVETEQELVETDNNQGLVSQNDEPVTPVPVEPTVTEASTVTHPAPAQPKKSNKNKWYIGIVAIIAVLGIGLYVLGNSLTSETRLINNFEKAVEDGDTKELKELLHAEDKSMKITDEGLKGFVALFESNSKELDTVVKSLKSKGKRDLQASPVTIQKDGKKWLIFDNYKLVVRPVFFTVSTNYEDTSIFVGDEEVAVSDSGYFDEEIGPFMPGEYVLRASHNTGFSNIDAEETVVHSDPEFSKYVDLYIDASSVYFSFADYQYTDLKSIKLYINGKETDYDLIKDQYVEPILTDGSMNASFEAEFPWGTILTNEVPIDSTDVTVDFAHNEEFQEEIIGVIMDFNTEFIKFFTELNIDDLTTVSVSFAELLIDDIAPQLDSGLEYQGSFHGADFYLDSFTLTQNYNDIWFVEVDGITYYEEAFYEEGEEAPNLEQVEEETRFVLGYDQSSKEWIVSGLDYASWMDEDDMDRHTVENPEVYTSQWNSKKDDDKDKKKDKKKDKDKD